MTDSDLAAALAGLRADLVDLLKEVSELRDKVAQGIGGMRVLTWMLHAAGFLAAAAAGWLTTGGKH